ncbi:uncharacterized protein LOC143036806 isoform X2 [Oratosquilla oratoria]
MGSDPKCSIEQRAVCRLSEHKTVKTELSNFRKEHPDWAVELPDIFMGLGIRHRKQKLKRKQGKGLFEKYMKRERIVLQLLQDLCGCEWKNRFDYTEENLLNTKEDCQPDNSKSVAKASNHKEKDVMDTSGSLEDISRVLERDNKIGESVSGSTSEEENSDDEDAEEVASDDEETGLASGSEMSTASVEENVDYDGLNTTQEEHQNTSSEGESEDETLANRHNYVKHLQDSDLNENKVQRTKDKLQEALNSKPNKEKQPPSKVSKKLLKKMSSTMKHKQNKKNSKAMVVQQLNLDNLTEEHVIEPVLDKNEDSSDEESDDEIMQKKAGKISSFFIGGVDEEESEDNDSDEENNMSRESRFGESSRHDIDEEMDDSVIDSGRYFRRNMFRGDNPQVNVKEGMRKGLPSKERMGMKHGKDGGRREQKIGGFKDDRREGGRNNEQRDFRNKGRFSDEGSSRRGGYNQGFRRGGLQGFSRGGRGRGDGNRRERRQKINGRGSFRDENNPNLIPVATKEFIPPQTKVASVTASAAPEVKLHPSWEAKKRMKTQSSGLGQFQGSRVVFDD